VVRAFILTGAPGSGKTAILRHVERSSRAVVEEAATDVIALEQALGVEEPWTRPTFIDAVVSLQRQRFERARASGDDVVVLDRSPLCTLALSRYLGVPPSPTLLEEVRRATEEPAYERRVLFVRNQGHVRETAARRITFEESLRFERIHEDVYLEHGFRLVDVPAGPLPERVAVVEAALDA
jgi:predicted ATPase